MNITMIKRDNILPISFDAPSMSPVVYLKLLLVIKTMIIPEIIPPNIPMTPMYLRAKNPKMMVKNSEIANNLLFMLLMKYCPVPLSNGLEKVAQLSKLILAAISDTKSVGRM